MGFRNPLTALGAAATVTGPLAVNGAANVSGLLTAQAGLVATGQITMDGSASFTAPITVKGLQVRHLAFGSTVATPDAAGKITLFYGVTFTTVPFPLVCSGSGGLIVEGNTGTTSSGVAVLRDTTGALITAGLRRVTWCVSGVLA